MERLAVAGILRWAEVEHDQTIPLPDVRRNSFTTKDFAERSRAQVKQHIPTTYLGGCSCLLKKRAIR
jgi:hypothetical protein